MKQYMSGVQDMPESDGELEVSDDEEDDERNRDIEELEDGRLEDEVLDEGMSQEQIAHRQEALRIHRALGNDELDLSLPNLTLEDISESEPDSDSEASSVGPPATDFTTYTQGRKFPGRPPRISAKQMGEKAGVKDVVTKERAKAGRREGAKNGAGAGKVKGHKWKSNDKYLVARDNGW